MFKKKSIGLTRYAINNLHQCGILNMSSMHGRFATRLQLYNR